MGNAGKRWAWLLAALALITACSDDRASGSQAAAGAGAANADSLPPTAETLVGGLDAPGDANVAWVRTLPGEVDSAPVVVRGPGNELIVLLIAERRPLAEKRFLDDWLLLRLDADTGALRWLQVVDSLVQLALDTQGNIILAWPTLLKKLDPDGKLLWERPRQPENVYEAVNLAVDSNDNLLLARVELDRNLGSIGADPKGFVQLEKLDAMGTPIWSSRFGDNTSYLQAVWVTVDPANNPVLLAAGLEGPFDFGGGVALADNDVVVKYDSGGNHLFSKGFAGYGPTHYLGNSPVLADRDGNILIRTESVGEIDIGLGPFFCGRQYVIKLDPTGKAIWNTCTAVKELALLPDGGFVTTSTPHAAAEIGETQCTPNAAASKGPGAVFARYDADGNWIASHCVPEPGYSAAGAVAADGSEMMFMTAAFGSQLSLPGGRVALGLDQRSTALVAKVTLPKR